MTCALGHNEDRLGLYGYGQRLGGVRCLIWVVEVYPQGLIREKENQGGMGLSEGNGGSMKGMGAQQEEQGLSEGNGGSVKEIRTQ